ncbi:hypothetical protein CHUUTOTORO_02440 [Serratia phage vB_SmaM-ChuuTotoro]|nr:hypothetical protein CHUUTOTORO_02440 [Serratia phage vB_SmaM-ChuuTotoro]
MIVKDLSKDLAGISDDKLRKMRDVANDNYLEAKVEMESAEQYLWQIFAEMDRRKYSTESK